MGLDGQTYISNSGAAPSQLKTCMHSLSSKSENSWYNHCNFQIKILCYVWFFSEGKTILLCNCNAKQNRATYKFCYFIPDHAEMHRAQGWRWRASTGGWATQCLVSSSPANTAGCTLDQSPKLDNFPVAREVRVVEDGWGWSDKMTLSWGINKHGWM